MFINNATWPITTTALSIAAAILRKKRACVDFYVVFFFRLYLSEMFRKIGKHWQCKKIVPNHRTKPPYRTTVPNHRTKPPYQTTQKTTVSYHLKVPPYPTTGKVLVNRYIFLENEVQKILEIFENFSYQTTENFYFENLCNIIKCLRDLLKIHHVSIEIA